MFLLGFPGIARLDLEQLIAGCAVIVSAIAVLLALYEGILSRAHARLSVKPALEIELEYSEREGLFSVQLGNKGLGPAYITEYRIQVDGETLRHSAVDVWEKVFEKVGLSSSNYRLQSLNSGTVIAANEHRLLLRAELKNEDAEAICAIARITIEVLYKSAYDEPYVARMLGADFGGGT